MMPNKMRILKAVICFKCIIKEKNINILKYCSMFNNNTNIDSIETLYIIDH